MNALAEFDYPGEPAIVSRGYQLCALPAVCEQAARSLGNVADGGCRDGVTSSLGGTMGLAEATARDRLFALEQARLERTAPA